MGGLGGGRRRQSGLLAPAPRPAGLHARADRGCREGAGPVVSRPPRLLRVAAAAAIVCGSLVPATASAATIDVTTTADEANVNTGACSLREAITAASQNSTANASGCATAGSAGSPDTVMLGAGNYALSGLSGDDANASGDLDVSDSGSGGVLIQGLGQVQTTITAVAGDRALQLLGGGLALQDLT